MPGVVFSLIIIGYLTFRDSGFGWMGTWWLWLFVLPWPALLYFGLRNSMSAGADWFKYDKEFVKTYELVSVKVSTSGSGAYYLDLEDSAGRKVSLQLGTIQQNRALWDLVYNGILHSVHRGRATTNRRALDHLQLMNPPR